MILRIDHIGLVSGDLPAAAESMGALGLTKFDEGVADSYGVACEFWRSGEHPHGASIELVAPVRDGAAVQGHLDRQGPGLHHIAFEVDDIETELDALRRRGGIPVDKAPADGARTAMKVAFVYLGTATGLLVELVQYSRNPRAA